MRTIKILLFLGLAAFAGVAGYAYLGDMSPDRGPMVIRLEAGDGR
jgi:hypothetical protein